jgi:hypothetical protein
VRRPHSHRGWGWEEEARTDTDIPRRNRDHRALCNRVVPAPVLVAETTQIHRVFTGESFGVLAPSSSLSPLPPSLYSLSLQFSTPGFGGFRTVFWVFWVSQVKVRRTGRCPLSQASRKAKPPKKGRREKAPRGLWCKWSIAVYSHTTTPAWHGTAQHGQ